MPLFSREKIVDIDLKERVLEECITYFNVNEVWTGELYLKEIFEANHIQIATKKSKSYEGGIHDIIYDKERKQIVIKSRYEKSAFMIYLYLFMPAVVLLGAEENQLKVIGIGVAMFIFFTLMLSLSIKSESEKVEFNLMQQVNYFKRNNRRVYKRKKKEKS